MCSSLQCALVYVCSLLHCVSILMSLYCAIALIQTVWNRLHCNMVLYFDVFILRYRTDTNCLEQVALQHGALFFHLDAICYILLTFV